MGVTISPVRSIAKTGSAQLRGNVTLSEGSNITLTQSGNDISIAASGGSGDMVLASVQTVTGAKTFNAGKLLDKGEIVFDVKAYGAVGDGSTDDTAAIQSAIDAANTAGGGIVWFPKGNYKLVTNPIKLYSGSTPTIVPYNNITLLGAGSDGINGSQLKQTSTGVDTIKGLNDAANGAQALNNRIMNLSCVWGTATKTNSGNGIYLAQQAADGPSFQDWSIENVVCSGFQATGKYGFNLESIITSNLKVCQAVDCANGFLLNGDSATTGYSSVNTSTTLQNCYANLSTNGVNGYRIIDSTYLSLVGCAADFGANSAGSGYLIEGSNDVSLIGCGVELDGTVTLTNGFKVDDDANTNPSAQVNLIGCYMFQPKSTKSVYVTGASVGVTLIGFQVNSAVSGDVGITLDAGTSLTNIDSDIAGSSTATSINATAVYKTPGTPRRNTVTSSATPSINVGATDVFDITALATNITSMTTNLTGTAVDGQKLWISFLGTGSRTIAWGNSFESGAATLPTSVSTTRIDVGFIWNTATSKWRCMAEG